LPKRKYPYWLTYKQAVALGGFVKKGEKSSVVVFWKMLDSKTEKDSKGVPKKVPMLWQYNVFNLDQTEGIEAPKEDEKLEFTPIEQADKIVTGYTFRDGPAVLEQGQQACYSPTQDTIYMPAKETFVGIPNYYSTIFHEMTHSTGHKKRLNRIQEDHCFDSDSYSKEELVAEIGASFLMAETGIEVDDSQKQSEAYIAGWLKKLNSDKKFVVVAAGKAQHAVDLIMNRYQKKEEEEE